MPKQASARSAIARARANAELIDEVRSILKDTRLEVLGHLDDAAGGLCCGKTGTVAMVRIEKGRPPERRARKTRT